VAFTLIALAAVLFGRDGASLQAMGLVAEGLDIRLAGMDGYEVAQQLRAQSGLGNTVLVGITGDPSAADPQRSQEAGLACLLTKPVDLQALAGMLGEKLGGG
jgi:CheY-like chemotaxis protein